MKPTSDRPVLYRIRYGGTRTGAMLLASVTLTFLLTLAACSRSTPESNDNGTIDDQFLAFGTIINISFYGVDEQRAREASALALQDFQTMHSDWHAWQPGSLGRVNTLLPTGKRFNPGPALLNMIELARTLSASSGGLFNPAIGKLIALWGFHSDELPDKPPAAPAIDALLDAHPRMEDIRIDGIFIRTDNPAVQLDLGAMAKGYGIDRVLDDLAAFGIDHVIVNAGGDLRVRGRHGDRPWRIGIRHPSGTGIYASLDVRDGEAVFTSGDYERRFEYQGRRYHHIIDPRSGYPAVGTASVTVVHDNAAIADAAATALFVAGPDDWPAVARAMGIQQVLLIDSNGQASATPAMAERLQFTARPAPAIRIVTLQ